MNDPNQAHASADDVHLIVAKDDEVVIERHPEDWLAIAIFWALAIIVFLQFFTRYVLNDSFAWTEEIARYLLMVVVFVGGATVIRRNTSIAVELVANVMRDGPARRILIAAVEITKLIFLALLAYFSLLITERMQNLYMTVFDWPMSVVYAGVAVGCFLMLFRQIQVFWKLLCAGFRREPHLPTDKV